jgi:hypothetical protein
LGHIQRHGGDSVAAAESFATARTALKRVATVDATQAVLIGYGKSPIADRARSVRELDLDQAAASLRLAISLGFDDLPMLRQNPDFWALLARADLQTLIKNMESTRSRGPLQPQKQQ